MEIEKNVVVCPGHAMTKLVVDTGTTSIDDATIVLDKKYFDMVNGKLEKIGYPSFGFIPAKDMKILLSNDGVNKISLKLASKLAMDLDVDILYLYYKVPCKI